MGLFCIISVPVIKWSQISLDRMNQLIRRYRWGEKKLTKTENLDNYFKLVELMNCIILKRGINWKSFSTFSIGFLTLKALFTRDILTHIIAIKSYFCAMDLQRPRQALNKPQSKVLYVSLRAQKYFFISIYFYLFIAILCLGGLGLNLLFRQKFIYFLTNGNWKYFRVEHLWFVELIMPKFTLDLWIAWGWWGMAFCPFCKKKEILISFKFQIIIVESNVMIKII